MMRRRGSSYSLFTPPITATLGTSTDEGFQLKEYPLPLHPNPTNPVCSNVMTPYEPDFLQQSPATQLYTKKSYTIGSSPVCTVMDTLKGLWGKKKELEISNPYDATHVNHIHFDFDCNEWRWGGCHPKIVGNLPVGQQNLLVSFVRRLYSELQITWSTSMEQEISQANSNDGNDGDDDGCDDDGGGGDDGLENSLPLTHEQATLRVQQICRLDNPTLTYQTWSRIGEGASGVVYRAYDSQGSPVAVKRIRLHRHPRHDLLLNEIIVAKSPKCHPNIVQHIESFLWRDCIWIVMECMDGGSLTDIVTYRYLFEHEIGTVCREVLQGLEYLHSHRIVHRDIKSDNILVDHLGHFKLSDFGFCARLNRHRPQRKTLAGTICWMAPEIVANEPYGCKVDIWSFGITVIEMIESKPPYFSHPERATTMLKYKQLPTLQHPERLTSTFRHFLYQCFDIQPQKRASATKLLRHPFLKKAGPTEALLPLINSSLHPSLLQQ